MEMEVEQVGEKQPVAEGQCIEIDDEHDHWVECVKCKEWRIVPKGTYLTFKKKDSKFYCRFAGATCHLTKRRRVQ